MRVQADALANRLKDIEKDLQRAQQNDIQQQWTTGRDRQALAQARKADEIR